MNREVRRTKTIDCFELSLEQVESLQTKFMDLYEGTLESFEIRVERQHEEIHFSSASEIRQFTPKLSVIREFSVFAWSPKLSVWIHAPSIGRPRITVSGNDPTRCAGVLSALEEEMKHYRAWYWMCTRVPFLIIQFLFLGGLAAGITAVWRLQTYSNWYLVAPSLILGIAAHEAQKRLLPAGKIVVANRESWMRRNATELNLAFAALNIVVLLVTSIKCVKQ